MVDRTTSTIVVALSAVALLILLNAVRKTITRGEWDNGALFGAFSVLALNLLYIVLTVRGDWIVVANSDMWIFLVPEGDKWLIKLLNGALVVASAAILLRGALQKTTINRAAVLFLLMTIVSSVSTVLHGDNPIRLASAVLPIVLIACTVAPRGLGIHVGIGTTCMAIAIVNGLSLATDEHFSVSRCLPSKCGVLGFLFRGIYPHENNLALFLALAIPFVYIAFRSWEGPILCAYLLGLALISGSRTGGVAAVVTLVMLILVRPNIRRPTWAPKRTGLLYLVVAVVFAVGLALPFYIDDPTAFSGRGQLWMLARNALADPATLIHGTGMFAWQKQVQDVGFMYLYSPHNQWLTILYSTGLIGFLLVIAAIVLLVRHAGRTYSLVVLCVLLPVFILSVTERPWPIDTADPSTWALVGALLCYPAARRPSGDQIRATSRGSGGLELRTRGAAVTSAPTVSVITISFRDLDGLKRTVQSVRAQIYSGRIEHIVIDGGSGDDLVDYLSGFEPGFAYWQSQPDGGRYDAMNQGIAHASGDLLWFMHSGDRFSDPDAVAQAVEAISAHQPREVWGFGIQNLIEPDGRSLRGRSPIPFDIRRFITRGRPIPHQAAFFGSSLVNKLGGYDSHFGIAADQLFMFGAALLREPITIQRVLCDFDQSGAGSTRPVGDHFRDIRRMCDIYGYYPLRGRRTSFSYMRCVEYVRRARTAASRTRRFLRAGLGVWVSK